MERTKTVTYRRCDFCDEHEAHYQCDGCEKDVCYECRERVGITYIHSLFCHGTGDGFYCHKCDETCKSELHDAYRHMRTLRRTVDDVLTRVRAQAKEVEAKIVRLRKEKG